MSCCWGDDARRGDRTVDGRRIATLGQRGDGGSSTTQSGSAMGQGATQCRAAFSPKNSSGRTCPIRKAAGKRRVPGQRNRGRFRFNSDRDVLFASKPACLHRFGGCGRFCTPEAGKTGPRARFRGVWMPGKNAAERRVASDLRFLEKTEDRGRTACTESGAVDEPGVHNPRFRARRARKRARGPGSRRGGCRAEPNGAPDPAHGGPRTAPAVQNLGFVHTPSRAMGCG